MRRPYKIVHGVDNVDCSKFFTPAWLAITRGIVFNYIKRMLGYTVVNTSSVKRVVDAWNRLSEDVVGACKVR